MTAILTNSELCGPNSSTVVPATMALSLEGSNFIKAHEGGFRDKEYPDSAGNPTIGYGHKLNGESFPDGITKDKASELFAQDVKNAVRLVNVNINVPLNQHQFDAMVSLAYNLRNFSSLGIVAKINEMGTITKGDFTKYNHSGGVEVRGLTIRRTDEFNLFSNGVYH
jgi:lysozyme